MENGIVHQSTCVNSPQQNGIAERKNRHLLEVARALLFSTKVPKYLWGEAVLTAAHLINRMPSRVLNLKTPFEKKRATRCTEAPAYAGSGKGSHHLVYCTQP
jgi:hypothetical protein